MGKIHGAHARHGTSRGKGKSSFKNVQWQSSVLLFPCFFPVSPGKTLSAVQSQIVLEVGKIKTLHWASLQQKIFGTFKITSSPSFCLCLAQCCSECHQTDAVGHQIHFVNVNGVLLLRVPLWHCYIFNSQINQKCLVLGMPCSSTPILMFLWFCC